MLTASLSKVVAKLELKLFSASGKSPGFVGRDPGTVLVL